MTIDSRMGVVENTIGNINRTVCHMSEVMESIIHGMRHGTTQSTASSIDQTKHGNNNRPDEVTPLDGLVK